jgi:hypothetical protein
MSLQIEVRVVTSLLIDRVSKGIQYALCRSDPAFTAHAIKAMWKILYLSVYV